MGHDVFISHAAIDKVIADAITNSLEAGGVKCWVAPRDIRPGDTWGGSIVKAIENCSIMVVLFSSNSNKSRQVLREVERAVQKNVVVVPFRIENVEPTGDMEYFLSATHWLDAMVGDMDMHYAHLLETTLSILEREASSSVSEPQESTPKPKTQKPPKVKQEPSFEEPPTLVEPAQAKEPESIEEPAPLKEPTRELESKSEMELASALDQEREGQTATEIEAAAPLGETVDTVKPLDNKPKDTAARPTSQRVTAEPRVAPELMIDGKHNRREKDQPKKPPMWLIATAAAIPVLGISGWLLVNSELLNTKPTTEPTASVETPAKEAPMNAPETKKIVAATEKKKTPEKPKAAPKKKASNAVAKKPVTKKSDNPITKSTAIAAPKLTQQEKEDLAIQQAIAAEERRLAAKKAAAEKAHNNLVAKAKGGDAASMLTLAKNYQTGNGIARNNKEAETWFIAAAEAGNAEAQYTVSKLLANDETAAVKWLIQAADQNVLPAQTSLAERYSSGTGVAQNDAMALQWYRRAAEGGSLEAQKNLATLYEFGIGTNRDLSAALKWYQSAAAQGDRSSKLYVQKLLEKAPSLNVQPESVNNTQPTTTKAPDVIIGPDGTTRQVIITEEARAAGVSTGAPRPTDNSNIEAIDPPSS